MNLASGAEDRETWSGGTRSGQKQEQKGSDGGAAEENLPADR
jgi:hypothetical protein